MVATWQNEPNSITAAGAVDTMHRISWRSENSAR
jgi:hypothetical protein